MPVSSSTKSAPYPASGASGRGQVSRTSSGAHLSEPAETANVDQLIGQKVRTRWPDDNNFYEAVIYDYNPAEVNLGFHTICFFVSIHPRDHATYRRCEVIMNQGIIVLSDMISRCLWIFSGYVDHNCQV